MDFSESAAQARRGPGDTNSGTPNIHDLEFAVYRERRQYTNITSTLLSESMAFGVATRMPLKGTLNPWPYAGSPISSPR
jgi:hypothetical protein